MKKLNVLIISLLFSVSSFSAEELIDSIERSVNYMGEEIIQFHVNFPLEDTIYQFDSTNSMLEWVKVRSLFSSKFPGVTIQIPLTLIVDTLTGWRVIEIPVEAPEGLLSADSTIMEIIKINNIRIIPDGVPNDV